MRKTTMRQIFKEEEEVKKSSKERYTEKTIIDFTEIDSDHNMDKLSRLFGTVDTSKHWPLSIQVPVYDVHVFNSPSVFSRQAHILVSLSRDRKSFDFSVTVVDTKDEKVDVVSLPDVSTEGAMFVAKSPIIYGKDKKETEELAISIAKDIAVDIIKRYQTALGELVKVFEQ